MILSRGLWTYHSRRFSFVFAVGMAIYTGVLLLNPKNIQEKLPSPCYLSLVQLHIEYVTWMVDLDSTSSFIYHMLLLILPVNSTRFLIIYIVIFFKGCFRLFRKTQRPNIAVVPPATGRSIAEVIVLSDLT